MSKRRHTEIESSSDSDGSPKARGHVLPAYFANNPGPSSSRYEDQHPSSSTSGLIYHTLTPAPNPPPPSLDPGNVCWWTKEYQNEETMEYQNEETKEYQNQETKEKEETNDNIPSFEDERIRELDRRREQLKNHSKKPVGWEVTEAVKWVILLTSDSSPSDWMKPIPKPMVFPSKRGRTPSAPSAETPTASDATITGSSFRPRTPRARPPIRTTPLSLVLNFTPTRVLIRRRLRTPRNNLPRPHTRKLSQYRSKKPGGWDLLEDDEIPKRKKLYFFSPKEGTRKELQEGKSKISALKCITPRGPTRLFSYSSSNMRLGHGKWGRPLGAPSAQPKSAFNSNAAGPSFRPRTQRPCALTRAIPWPPVSNFYPARGRCQLCSAMKLIQDRSKKPGGWGILEEDENSNPKEVEEPESRGTRRGQELQKGKSKISELKCISPKWATRLPSNSPSRMRLIPAPVFPAEWGRIVSAPSAGPSSASDINAAGSSFRPRTPQARPPIKVELRRQLHTPRHNLSRLYESSIARLNSSANDADESSSE